MVGPPVLSSEDHAYFFRHGFIILRGAVSPEQAEKMATVLETARQERKPPAKGALPSLDLRQIHAALGELFGPGRRFGPAERHTWFGHDMPKPVQQPSDGPQPSDVGIALEGNAHIDDSYPTLMPQTWALGSFLFLTRVRHRGGAFIVYPGSWLLNRKVLGAHVRAVTPQSLGEPVEILAEPGDAIIFHYLLGHSGSKNVADPCTRHALLNRYYCTTRFENLCDLPFEQMSTLEKMASARYIRHSVGDGFCMQLPPSNASTLALHGVDLAGAQSYAVIHLAGQFLLLYILAEAPHALFQMKSTNLCDWMPAPAPVLPSVGKGSETVPFSTVQLYNGFRANQEGEAVLSVTDVSGNVFLFSSLDGDTWQPLATKAPSSRTATPWWASSVWPRPSRMATGKMLYYVPRNSQNELMCMWGDTWDLISPASTDCTSKVLAAPAPIDDVTVDSRFGDFACALVVDLARADESTGRAHYAVPRHSDWEHPKHPTQLHPLVGHGNIPLRRLRVLSRGRSFWLVTFLARRPDGDTERMYVGTIEWAEEPPTVRFVRMLQDLEAAFAAVGWV
eukprot:gnl/TRDRNA2_/TRDRNA2_156165_c0_seq1.p1 gnl/TRDRNA2_/TRDRNA2_156165_c0~~gnl/TRDRNA2_/TRDRNA2_156165_c0_seq1.p1  ORF type:complete len:618 (+),score=65.72 gnl/TRDRNA2_/TRDRNA2_156165_c0_seq1:168-1856(+)